MMRHAIKISRSFNDVDDDDDNVKYLAKRQYRANNMKTTYSDLSVIKSIVT